MPQPEDQALLAAYLKERRTPCPGCNYELRGLTADHCPECNTSLLLTIEQKGTRGPVFWLLLLLFSWFLIGGAFNAGRTIQWVRQDLQSRQRWSRDNEIRALVEYQLHKRANGGIPTSQIPALSTSAPPSSPTTILDRLWYYTDMYSLRAVLMTLAGLICIPFLFIARRRASPSIERRLTRFALAAMVIYVGSGMYAMLRWYW